MTDEENAKLRAEAVSERARAKVAGIVAAVAAIVALVIVGILCYVIGYKVLSMLPPLLAFALSAALVSGARALEGPIRFGSRRRETSSASGACAALLLWLACFCAIQIAFLTMDVFDRSNLDREPCAARAGKQFRGALTISSSGATRTLALTWCGEPK